MTSYSDTLSTKLPRRSNGSPLVLDLFSGSGGMSLGFEAAGFATFGIDANPDCCESYNNNLSGECSRSVLSVDSTLPDADIIVGGPPCQPFSVSGRQLGANDPRNCVPVFIEAIRRQRPSMFVFENVRGLMYRSKPYFDVLLRKLRAFGYHVKPELVNAADYGVPQNRQRIFLVGHHGEYQFPPGRGETVSAGCALSEIPLSCMPVYKYLTPNADAYIAKYERACGLRTPRDLNLDKPARTVTARNSVGATGDMLRLRLPDGRRRRLTVREVARLQAFPDWFTFAGNQTSQFEQIGNAVPPLLALNIAESIRSCLDGDVLKPKGSSHKATDNTGG